jgi:nucleoside-diphosphate-sugar epimerase
MVFEQTNKYPTPESEILTCPPPLSTYGFQKLASEYFCKGAWEQYKLPYTILRPFNCIGLGETRALKDSEITHGNIKLMLSHVLPDLINKSLKLSAADKLPILGEGNQVRHYTHGKDIARGIRIAMESPEALNNDFNISHDRPMTVAELAQIVWKRIHNADVLLDPQPAYEYDVQIRSPDVSKARDVLGFKAEISVEESIDEIIDWMRTQIEMESV